MFVASRLAWLLLDPVAWLWWLGAALVVTTLWRNRVWPVRLAWAWGGVVVVFALLPVGPWLLGTLEDRFPAPSPPPTAVRGIIILGGALDPRLSALRAQPVLGEPAERLTAGAALAHRFPDATVVFSGGNGQLDPTAPPESHAALELLVSLGVDRARIRLEETSRNTFENAQNTRPILEESPGTWLLVTSAAHLPRAVGAFRQAGCNVVGWPVDFHTAPDGTGAWRISPTGNLLKASAALHEWLGLLAYRALGRSDALFPAP